MSALLPAAAQQAVMANGQLLQMDPQGRVVRRSAADGSFTPFEPFHDLWRSNPQRGQSRAASFVETGFGRGGCNVRGRTDWQGSTSVGHPRKLQTPAGGFEVVPIESSLDPDRLARQLDRGRVEPLHAQSARSAP